MNTVCRHVTTRIAFRGFRKLVESCNVATVPLQDESRRSKLVGIHGLTCAYNLFNKLHLEDARIWGQNPRMSALSYRPVDNMIALAIESYSAWKNPYHGVFIYADLASSLPQVDKMRRIYYKMAFGEKAPADQSDFGNSRLNELASFEHEIRRSLGNQAMRVVSETTDFSILHVGVVVNDNDFASAVGFSDLSHTSELLCVLLRAREYSNEGLAYAYIPTDDSDRDSIHLTSGYSVGMAWSRPEALIQLRSVVCPSSVRV